MATMKKQYSELIKEALIAAGYSSDKFIDQDKFNGRSHFIAGFNTLFFMMSDGKYELVVPTHEKHDFT